MLLDADGLLVCESGSLLTERYTRKHFLALGNYFCWEGA